MAKVDGISTKPTQTDPNSVGAELALPVIAIDVQSILADIQTIPRMAVDADSIQHRLFAMAGGSTDTSPESRFSEDIIRESAVLERILEVEYGFLPLDHPVSQYVNNLVGQIFPGFPLTVKVAQNEEAPNALCLATGTLVVTKGLLKILTQDELAFILGHEGRHFVEGHAQEIKDAITEAKSRYQKKEKDLGSVARILGVLRFSEGEADIKGTIDISKDFSSVAAARSALMKINNYQKEAGNLTGKRGVVHGGLIDRIINVGIASQLRDFVTTSKPQVDLPATVQSYAKKESKPWLLTQVENAFNEEEIIQALKSASIKSILLALGKMEHSEYKNSKIKNNLKIFRKLALQKIEEQMKTFHLDESQQKLLMHAFIELCIGIRTDDAYSEYEKAYQNYTTSFEDIQSLEELYQMISVFSLENWEKADAIIPSFEDTTFFIGHILKSANENGLFLDENSDFDVKAYVNFSKTVVSRFHEISQHYGLQPINLESLTEILLEEAILNLKNLTENNRPLYEIIGGFREAGINLGVMDTIRIIQSSKHSEQSADELKKLREYLYEGDPYWKIVLEGEFEYRYAESLSILNLSIDIIRSVEKGLDPLLNPEYAYFVEAHNNFNPQNIHELFDYWNWLHEKADKVSEIHEKSRFEGLLKVSFINFIFFGKKGFSTNFLERLKLAFGLLNSMGGTRDLIIFEILRDLFLDIGNTKTDSVQDEQRLNIFEDLLLLLSGEASFYTDHQLKQPSFKPIKMSSPIQIKGRKREEKYIQENSTRPFFDNYILEALVYYYITSLNKLISTYNKQQICFRINWITDFIFRHVNYFAVEGNRLNEVLDFLVNVLEKFDFDLDDKVDQETLLNLSKMISDPTISLKLQNAVLKKRTQNADFNQRLHFLFKDARTRYSMTTSLQEDFIENQAQTPDEMDATIEAIKEKFNQVTDAENVGGAVLLETLNDLARGKKEQLSLLMEMSEDDTAIKELIFTNIRGDGIRSEINSDEEDIVETERLVEQMTQANDIIRYAIIRNLLVGENGLLLTQSGRLWLIDYFYDKHIETDDSNPLSRKLNLIVKEALTDVALLADADLLYFAISRLLQERMMRPSIKPTNWKKILEDAYSGYSSKEEIAETIDKANRLINGESVRVTKVSFVPSGERREDLYVKTETEVEGQSQTNRLYLLVENILRKAQIKDETPKPVQEKWSIEDFTIKLAESLGAAGVRFLQIIGQYVDLPEKLQNAFRDVYDNVSGQIKLTASQTMEREWPDFRKVVKRVIKRIGGGSLMSAYLCEMHDGSFEVVKVLAPNAMMQLDITMQLLKTAFAQLATKNPARYKAAVSALNEIEQWIKADVNYTQFLEKDLLFRANQEKFKTQTGFDYSIYVPHSLAVNGDGTDNIYVKREEYINGQTLTGLDLWKDREAARQVAALITKNYMQQIQDGLVHSDVHPGNFMVFQDAKGQKRVAILDRNFYIELDDDDKAVLFSSQAALAMGIPQQAVRLIGNHISKKQNITLTDEQWGYLEKSVQQKSYENPSQMISDVMVAFKHEGIQVPLKLTLMVKNLNGLNHLVKMAGFNSINQAYAYQPKAVSDGGSSNSGNTSGSLSQKLSTNIPHNQNPPTHEAKSLRERSQSQSRISQSRTASALRLSRARARARAILR